MVTMNTTVFTKFGGEEREVEIEVEEATAAGAAQGLRYAVVALEGINSEGTGETD